MQGTLLCKAQAGVQEVSQAEARGGCPKHEPGRSWEKSYSHSSHRQLRPAPAELQAFGEL